ncbi:DUF4219 domain-containing protein [Tanacetum coccineum]
MEGKLDLIIGNYTDGNLVASLMANKLGTTLGTFAHALEKTKYEDSDMKWKELDPKYHFLCWGKKTCGRSIDSNMLDDVVELAHGFVELKGYVWQLYIKMSKDNDNEDEGPNEDVTELARVASKLRIVYFAPNLLKHRLRKSVTPGDTPFGIGGCSSLLLFETYVKSKDLDLWHVISNGDFQPIEQNPKTKLDVVIPFEKQSDDLKKRLAKNYEAKMVIYNALPRKEYERIFMCNTTKENWKTLLITHQGNNQVKDKKIDILVQQYEQFVISKDKYINSAFARFNTIIISLKALDKGYSSKNYVRKFLRALL